VVLAGNEDGFRLSIVDGQQRLTVVTTLISAICEKLKTCDESEYAKSIYDNYVEGSAISEGDPTISSGRAKYFKLDRISDSNYFKLSIQYFEKEERDTESIEDRLLKKAYEFFIECLSKENIERTFYDDREVTIEQYTNALKAISHQLTTKVKVIKVVVADEDDAYIIFEILNARGMDLDAADLIKNKIFSDLRTTHPIDYAKDGWDAVKNNLTGRNKNIRLISFIRHWWNAHHVVVSEGSLYKAFKEQIKKGNYSCDSFLDSLKSDSALYAKIAEPKFEDWRENTAKRIYFSLMAFKIFNVSISRPLILGLFESFARRKIRQNDLIMALENLERFHFMFNAVCSLRPSGVENTFSSISRRLISAKDRREGRLIINELNEKLRAKMPSREVFIEKFSQLYFTNRKSSDKKLIQYVFSVMDRHMRGTHEVIASDMSLEHILPQGLNEQYVGFMGNLLPLSESINGHADRRSFQEKCSIYLNSNFMVTQAFSRENSAKHAWTERDIHDRTISLVNYGYDNIWSI
jgi:uncharacterized protein with ParB-like and HNH nuclease domain